MLSKKLISIFAYALLVLGFSSTTASAQCPLVPAWDAVPPPQVNKIHIFCGEIDAVNGNPKGYHSKVYAPATNVVAGTVNPTPAVNGVYDARVNFINGRHKNSTFFPDTCTQAQIIASARYANAHRIVPVPAVPWGYVGPSAPAAAAAGYCVGADTQPINVRVGLLGVNINTAFPHRNPGALLMVKSKHDRTRAGTADPVKEIVHDFLNTDIGTNAGYCDSVLDLLTQRLAGKPDANGERSSTGNLYRLSVEGKTAVLVNIYDETVPPARVAGVDLLKLVKDWRSKL